MLDARSTPTPTMAGMPRSGIVAGLSLPAASSCTKVNSRVSWAVNGPSFVSNCVGSKIPYDSPFT